MILIRYSQSPGHLTGSTRDWRGVPVTDVNGTEMGTVTDMLYDLHSKRIRFLEVSLGGFLGLGEKHFLIDANDIRQLNSTVTVSKTREQILNLPQEQNILPMESTVHKAKPTAAATTATMAGTYAGERARQRQTSMEAKPTGSRAKPAGLQAKPTEMKTQETGHVSFPSQEKRGHPELPSEKRPRTDMEAQPASEKRPLADMEAQPAPEKPGEKPSGKPSGKPIQTELLVGERRVPMEAREQPTHKPETLAHEAPSHPRWSEQDKNSIIGGKAERRVRARDGFVIVEKGDTITGKAIHEAEQHQALDTLMDAAGKKK